MSVMLDSNVFSELQYQILKMALQGNFVLLESIALRDVEKEVNRVLFLVLTELIIQLLLPNQLYHA